MPYIHLTLSSTPTTTTPQPTTEYPYTYILTKRLTPSSSSIPCIPTYLLTTSPRNCTITSPQRRELGDRHRYTGIQTVIATIATGAQSLHPSHIDRASRVGAYSPCVLGYCLSACWQRVKSMGGRWPLYTLSRRSVYSTVVLPVILAYHSPAVKPEQQITSQAQINPPFSLGRLPVNVGNFSPLSVPTISRSIYQTPIINHRSLAERSHLIEILELYPRGEVRYAGTAPPQHLLIQPLHRLRTPFSYSYGLWYRYSFLARC